MRLPVLPALILTVLLAAPLQADEGWISAAKARTPQDISLWTRTVPGAELKAFRGATHVDVPVAGMAAFLYDTHAMPDWIFRCREARILAEHEDGTVDLHLKIKGIWPLEDRDAVIHVTPEVTPGGGLRLTGVAAPDLLPLQPGYIRIPSIESTWLMQPADNGLLRIEWSGHVDPAGNVPRWLANALVTLVPRYTLRHVHMLTEDEKWRSPARLEQGWRLIERSRRRAP
ncbi:MAG: START domain-containing protein [Pseudomonadota bacterium]